MNITSVDAEQVRPEGPNTVSLTKPSPPNTFATGCGFKGSSALGPLYADSGVTVPDACSEPAVRPRSDVEAVWVEDRAFQIVVVGSASDELDDTAEEVVAVV